jgi:hypothetical protein
MEKEEAANERQRRDNYISVARNQHATKEGLLEVLFSVCVLRRDYIVRQTGNVRQGISPWEVTERKSSAWGYT